MKKMKPVSPVASPRALTQSIVTSAVVILFGVTVAAGGENSRKSSLRECLWVDGNSTVECRFADASVPDVDGLNAAANDRLLAVGGDERAVKTLRLQCFRREERAKGEPEREGTAEEEEEDAVPQGASLRQILDEALTRVERRLEGDPWEQLEELEVNGCPLGGQLSRIDLLFIASSLTSATKLGRLRITSAFDEGGERSHHHVPLAVKEASAFHDGPGSLADLDLSSNGLTSLPRGLLCPLRHTLVRLNLSSNALESISDIGLWDKRARVCRMVTLESLSLARNGLRLLPRGSFASLAGIRNLDISHNAIARVAGKILNDANQLEVLNLAHNQLTRIPQDLLGGGNSSLRLTELYLSGNNLTAVPGPFLRRLTSLVLLNLSGNALQDDWLATNPLSGLKSLVALDLSHNQLTRLGAGQLSELTSLQVLTVAHNRLLSVSEKSFTGLGLHALVLAHNELTDLPVGLFDGLGHLNSLTLNHNSIRALHR